ncbi:MAG TPA: plastocyanin/azurin family copper-binding protein [Solirubrobacteraceae bacterium]
MRRTGLLAVLLAALAAPPAQGAVEEKVLRYGPVTLAPYEVHREEITYGVPAPQVDGWLTAISANVVNADGSEVPISRTMLHHIVLANTGARLGERRDATCETFTLFDGERKLPRLGERFYAAGEERARLDLPPGYGYRIRAGDRWAMSLMLMNHRNRTDKVFVEYRVRVETGADLRPVDPWWLDVANCRLDPIYDVPGNGRRGSTHVRDSEFVAPAAGRLVFGGAHLHGGGKRLTLRSVDCGNRVLYDSHPLWGLPTHAFYKVRPVLHEPGPISMAHFKSAAGIPVAKGERLRLTAAYDGELPHVRAMGIMILAFAPDPAVSGGCGALPGDVQRYQTTTLRGRTKTPRTTIPLNYLPPSQLGTGKRARRVSGPPGAPLAWPRGGVVDVGDLFFSPARLRVRRGATVSWRFTGTTLHNVTLAQGPRGFSSFDLNGDRTYSQRLRKPGTYRLFCALHPTTMLQTVTVR